MMLLSDLVIYLRVMANDLSVDLQEYTDDDLITNLRVAIMLTEAQWGQGYTISLNGSDYEVNPDPPSWLQILYVLNCAIHTRAFSITYSFDNKVTKVTNNSKDNDIKILQKTFDAIMQERRYGTTVGYSFNSFDDLLTRPNLILAEIEDGYR
jgi:hypothetical protein